ncbi:LytTR family two component transcriptional regulator [Tahibacter aquaticus]|uniref:LytTR family two component transcriptional regulator n=1 Tax=Tahibacter aquaticus TaxID=520092 RepID=A0A4R6YQ78_9GAMM|nr:LytTR family DNA-binding domain-containing protein [Tahibacter aquaticus]TDR40035.1 LytTR family two component transcriptional regulator [Tahibacter aquaticus]
MMLRVLVIDDEPLARRGVVARLARHADVEIVGECATAAEAIRAIAAQAPDLLFLDVRMPGLDGFELLRQLPPPQRPQVVFLTAYERFALRAFDAEAVDYLLKPIDDERFDRALERVRTARRARLPAVPAPGDDMGQARYPARFSVRIGRRLVVVHVADIDWIEAIGDYCGLHVGKQVQLVRETLQQLESRLDPALFVRVHRSAIVRITRVAELRAATNRDALARLHDGTVLKVSRTYSEALRRALGR